MILSSEGAAEKLGSVRAQNLIYGDFAERRRCGTSLRAGVAESFAKPCRNQVRTKCPCPKAHPEKYSIQFFVLNGFVVNCP
jgi:hypothetical protein